MPCINDQNTIKTIAKSYCSNGRSICQAFITAGYSKNYAQSHSKRLFGRKEFQVAVAAEEARVSAMIDVATADVIKELKRYAFREHDDAIKDANTGDRLRALELLGKNKGMFKDVIQDDRDTAPRPPDMTDEQIVADSIARRLQIKASSPNPKPPGGAA